MSGRGAEVIHATLVTQRVLGCVLTVSERLLL